MNGLLSKYFSKFFIQQWILGVARGNMAEIIRTRNFNPDISWIPLHSPGRLYADPFLYKTANGEYSILFEDYSMDDAYGKIAVMRIDNKTLNPDGYKVILDTHSHLSYPYIFREEGKVYVLPEAAQSGKLTCYEYDPVNRALAFCKDIIELPLLDSTILKYNGRYWLFATLQGEDADNKLNIYYADHLTGSYTAHPKNPVRTGLEGSRPAGKFIEVDGILYRPAQNSRYTYGEAMTIHRVKKLTESQYEEEFHMEVRINWKNKNNRGVHGIHTINSEDDIILVDGTRWRFSIPGKIRQFSLKEKAKKSNPKDK